ncbi:MAG: hypothetical protein IPJ65_42750 [Archangiaceae bacterium]|nr:hypothetical protein [Archangiaceae bacterium]
MKRLATIALALLAVSSAADSRKPPKGITLPRGCRDRSCFRARTVDADSSAVSYAQFEFAPADGAGMGAACACTTPTGAKGEALTFTRASSGTCLKGSTTTGIANGDMATCSTNQPRVGTGGTGPLKLLMEEARTNTFLRSNEFENAAWTKLGQGGSAAPSVTANQATAPDNTLTADQVVFEAANSLQRSVLYQISGFNGAGSTAVFVRGTATTPTGAIDLCSTSATCVQATFTTAGWSGWCSPNGTQISGGTTPFIGHAGQDTGLTKPAQTVYIAMAQLEAGASCSSYIATAGSSVTRAIENASFTVVAGSVNTAGSFASTVVNGDALGVGGGLSAFAANNRPLYLQALTARIFDGTTVVQTTAGTSWVVPHRFWSSWSGATMSVNNTTDGLTASGAFDGDMMSGSTTFEVGCGTSGPGPINAWIGQVCLDSSASRCR